MDYTQLLTLRGNSFPKMANEKAGWLIPTIFYLKKDRSFLLMEHDEYQQMVKVYSQMSKSLLISLERNVFVRSDFNSISFLLQHATIIIMIMLNYSQCWTGPTWRASRENRPQGLCRCNIQRRIGGLGPRQSFFGYDTDYRILLYCLHRLYSVVSVSPPIILWVWWRQRP